MQDNSVSAFTDVNVTVRKQAASEKKPVLHIKSKSKNYFQLEP